jgi:large subunit ribosomal protein L10
MGEKTLKIKQHKTEGVNEIKELVKSSRDVIFTDYRGLNVTQITQLRRALRERETEYRVIKNNYAKLAMEQLELPFAEEFLVDPTALALVRADVGPVAKLLFEFMRDSTLRIKGGLVEGRVVSAQDVESISRLPSREQLYAMLMGTINAPLSNMLQVMNGVISKLVRTVQAVADQKAKE